MTDLAVDRLGPGGPVQVAWFAGSAIGRDRGGAPRAPHRHDYHEAIWVRDGAGVQLVDGRELPVTPGTVTCVGRGSVHVFDRARDLHGAVLRFTDDALAGGAERVTATWLLAGAGGREVRVPPGDAPALEGVLRALDAEAARPPDPVAADVRRHLLATVLLWLERWEAGAHPEGRVADDAEAELHRRFTTLLERDFAAHHDVAHYADALAVPAAALARALGARTGRATKELVTDRVMAEAARLLRFTDRTVGEVAFAVGFRDPLYFSRAFKRWAGRSPADFRAAARGG